MSPAVDMQDVPTDGKGRLRLLRPRFWIALAVALTLVTMGTEAIGAWIGDGSFDVDTAVRHAIFAIPGIVIFNRGVRETPEA